MWVEFTYAVGGHWFAVYWNWLPFEGAPLLRGFGGPQAGIYYLACGFGAVDVGWLRVVSGGVVEFTQEFIVAFAEVFADVVEFYFTLLSKIILI